MKKGLQNFSAHTPEIRDEMCSFLDISSAEDLFSAIPQDARFELSLPDAISELDAQKRLKGLAQKNNVQQANFLGAGVYNRFIPAAVNTVAQRFEFITAYTPYQPEISQGTLQMIYEFQSMICSLTGMDVANASVYDGATACAEAILMAVRAKRKNKVLISDALNPEYKKVVETYCYGVDVDVQYLSAKNFKTSFGVESDYACVLVQNPNFYGEIEDLEKLSVAAKDAGAMFIVCADVLSLSLLRSPSDFGADIVVGDFQSLGLPMNFGGAHGGFMATAEKNMRQLPGRIVGMSIDNKGERAFTLTLQAREQHIRRERATSNICTNHGLMALCATVYMSLMGASGMRQAVMLSSQNAKNLANRLEPLSGVEVLNNNFLNEFVIKVDNAKFVIERMKSDGILAGIALDEDKILLCATEMNSAEEIDSYVSCLESILQGGLE